MIADADLMSCEDDYTEVAPFILPFSEDASLCLRDVISTPAATETQRLGQNAKCQSEMKKAII